jgi:hypothetical protein
MLPNSETVVVESFPLSGLACEKLTLETPGSALRRAASSP